jgi:hypothetical protein
MKDSAFSPCLASIQLLGGKRLRSAIKPMPAFDPQHACVFAGTGRKTPRHPLESPEVFALV